MFIAKPTKLTSGDLYGPRCCAIELKSTPATNALWSFARSKARLTKDQKYANSNICVSTQDSMKIIKCSSHDIVTDIMAGGLIILANYALKLKLKLPISLSCQQSFSSGDGSTFTNKVRTTSLHCLTCTDSLLLMINSAISKVYKTICCFYNNALVSRHQHVDFKRKQLSRP